MSRLLVRFAARAATYCAFVALLGLSLAVRPALAVDSTPPLPTAALQLRYVALTHELRCMQCQDEALADSPVNLAAEMRMEVHDLLLQGRSDRQVRDYMVSRYGEFVLFKPPFNGRNAWLWIAPFALLAIGAVVGWQVLAARRRLVDQDDSEIVDDLDEEGASASSALPHGSAPLEP